VRNLRSFLRTVNAICAQTDSETVVHNAHMTDFDDKSDRSPVCDKLKALRQEAKMSVREVAEAIGVPGSTYASYERRYKKPYLPVSLIMSLRPIFTARGIDRRRIDELGGLVEVGTKAPPPPHPGVATQTPPKYRSEVDFTRKIPIEPGERDLPLRSPLRAVRVIGDVQAGVFREALEWPPEEQFDVMIEVTPTASRYPVFGLRVLGPSMNQEFREGSVALCVRLLDLPDGYKVKPGQFVVVLRRNDHGPDQFEATIKEYHVDKNGRAWLMPRSDDPAFQAPIPADSLGNDDFHDSNDTVRIWAVVVGQNKAYGL
jgi:SOS-response transcriptional repressor LexA/DNA-binding transcriptional regulator YiaG